MNKNVNLSSCNFASHVLKLDLTLFQYLTPFKEKRLLLAPSQNFLHRESHPLPLTCPGRLRAESLCFLYPLSSGASFCSYSSEISSEPLLQGFLLQNYQQTKKQPNQLTRGPSEIFSKQGSCSPSLGRSGDSIYPQKSKKQSPVAGSAFSCRPNISLDPTSPETRHLWKELLHSRLLLRGGESSVTLQNDRLPARIPMNSGVTSFQSQVRYGLKWKRSTIFNRSGILSIFVYLSV